MASGDVVRLVNEGDTPFTDMYGSRPYSIPVGGQLMVDYDAVCLWLGHPQANDYDPRNRVRTQEYHRLRSRYGVDAQELEMQLQKLPVDTDELFQRLRPSLAAYDMAGDRIVTVADDPSGDSLSPAIDTSGDSQQLIMARMAQMEREMNDMRVQLAANARTEQALNDAQPIPVDNPDLIDDTRTSAGPPAIVGTIIDSTPADPAQAPRPTPRTTPGEDTPNRVRVSSPSS